MHFRKRPENRESERERGEHFPRQAGNIKTQDEITRKELQVSPTSATSFRSRCLGESVGWMGVRLPLLFLYLPLFFGSTLATLVENSQIVFSLNFVPDLRAHLYYTKK